MKTFRLSRIAYVTGLFMLTVPAGELLHASDLEIYKGNIGGTATVMLMLDTSGSMGYGNGYQNNSVGSMSIEDDYGVCTDSNGYSTVANNPITSGTTPAYNRYFCPVTASAAKNYPKVTNATTGCEKQSNGSYRCYDRLTRLKDALFKLMDDSSLKSDTAIGLGNFSAQGDGKSGQILVAAKPIDGLNSPQRNAIKTAAANLSANNGTPSAYAYAEVAAYMLGNATATISQNIAPKVSYAYDGYYYYKCADWKTNLSTLSDGTVYQDCKNDGYGSRIRTNPDNQARKLYDNRDYAYYVNIGTLSYNSTDNVNSGIIYSVDKPDIYDASTKKYISPLSQTNTSCNGQGIYFLTDGFPNSSSPTDALTIMKSALGSSGNSFSCNVSSTVFPDGEGGNGAGTDNTGAWQCIASFAKTLNDQTKNSFGQPIKTAVVGFGSDLAGVPYTFAADGISKVYNCASAPNNDARNTCNWGNKGAGYGEGGFYLGSNADDVINSIKQFVTDVTPDFKPTSLGTISIPRDPLDTTKAMGNGYFPMIQPLTDTTRRSWLGNLKKYIVANGTLTADTAGNTKLYNSDGTLNSSAKDTWSIQTSGDHSFITSGGALNKIIVPSNQNVTGDPSTGTAERRVFIIDNNQLKRVTKANLASNFTATTDLPALTDITTTTLNQRYALLNYLGYQTAYPPTATTITMTDLQGYGIPSSPYRFLAGVLHSSPVVLTKQATVTATATASGITESAARSKTEYTVYGSMDGGLHIVDAASGIEQSVFVPREILDNQPDTLAKTDASGTAPSNRTMALAYGVDAPWVADNTFNSTSRQLSDTTTTTYNAATMRVYGGLRMGGAGIYGLNILDPQNPKLLFRKTPSDSGFSRMAEIWSKPVIAYVRYNKQRTKVLIFGGGYDECYETATATCSSPKGNAVYIVKADDGTLLWSGSNSGATTNNTDMTNSIVAAPAIGDYNADGLVDAIWVADLGGQVFRIDIDNTNVNSMTSGSTTTTNSSFAVRRIATIAKLGSSVRFYERPTVGVFQEGQQRFIMVTVGSGNRSMPLSTETNYVYGLVDKDATADNLQNTSFTPSAAITATDLDTSGTLNGVSTTLPTGSAAIKSYIGGGTTDIKKGWAMNLAASVKVFEEPQLIYNNLYVSLYDPNAGNSATTSSCSGGVKGKSTIYRMCMPYGDCAAYHTTSKEGIFGVPIGPVNSSDPTKVRQVQIITTDGNNKEYCKGAGCNAATSNTDPSSKGYQYSQARSIRLLRWYEK